MQRLIIYLILIITLLAIAFSIYYGKDSYKLIPVNTQLNEQPEPLDQSWFEYDAPDGNFKVSLPLLPQTATQTIIDPQSGETKHYDMYVAQTDDGTIYLISQIDFIKDPFIDGDQEVLKQLMNGMVSVNQDNKLISSTPGTYLGFPSMDFEIENEKSNIKAKEFFDGHTVYLLTIVSNKNSKDKTHYDYFINSFKLIKKVKKSVAEGTITEVEANE